MEIHHKIKALKSIKLSEVRKVISEECYSRSTRQAFLWFSIDLSLFLCGMALVFCCQSTVVKLMGSLISGVATAMMFVWAHDAAHGTLFKNPRIANCLGTVFMLPALNVYRLWIYGHNKVHHGFTSFSPLDWIWRPLSPQEYNDLSRVQRALYRMERNLLTCAFHYLRKVWWQAMLRYNPAKNQQERRAYRNGKCYVLFYCIIMSALSYAYAGGLIGALCAVILPFIIFNYFISLIVYLHHTHPDIPFFNMKQQWSHSIGLLYCSTIVHCSKLSEKMLHSIMIHIPHHVDIRIPFYNLKRAYCDIKKHYQEYIHEYQFQWKTVRTIFKKCKLYDFKEQQWLTYENAKELSKKHP